MELDTQYTPLPYNLGSFPTKGCLEEIGRNAFSYYYTFLNLV